MNKKKSMYEIIKRQNGEAFVRAIRSYDARIFDIPNLPEIVKFAGNKSEPILLFLRSMIDEEKNEKVVETLNPFQLLKKAGYNAFLANSLKKQNSIEKYFAKGEHLCTFEDPHRFENYYIVHCIKKGAEELKRCDFSGKEQREDEYATSVISIQILKKGGFISIKNRYNHKVSNPDNTFNSNPDHIIAGLSQALKNYFKVDFHVQKSSVPDGYTYQNNWLYKYYLECNNIYFGENSYLKDGKIHHVNRDYQFLVSSFLFDLKEKKVTDLIGENSYVDVINAEMKGKKLQRKKEEKGFSLYLDGEKFLTVVPDFYKGNVINYITLFNTTVLPDSYLRRSNGLRTDSFLSEVRTFNAPNLKIIGNNCFHYSNMVYLNAPLVEEMYTACFFDCRNLKELILPNLKKMGPSCFINLGVEKIYLPQLEVLTAESLQYVPNVKVLVFPNLKRICKEALCANSKLERLVIPHVEKIEKWAICANSSLKRLYLPQVRVISASIYHNKNLKLVYAPKVTEIGNFSFCQNHRRFVLEAPQLRTVGEGALDAVFHLYAPKVYDLKGVCFLWRAWLNLGLHVKRQERHKNIFGLLNLYRAMAHFQRK